MVISRKSFVKAIEFGEDKTSTKPGFSQIRFARQRPVISRKGLVMAPEIGENVASTKPGPGQVGFD